MKIYVASDHRGFELKNKLVIYITSLGIEAVDLGPDRYIESDDYTDSAINVAKNVQKDKNSFGLLLCGSGVGMYITANKFKGIRASEVRSPQEAEEDRKHHDSNVLVIGADHNDEETSKEIFKTWINTEFDHGRHERRVREIEAIEEENIKEFRDSANIVPAILSDKLEDYVEEFEKYSKFSEVVNIDIMDGKFVENKTPGVFEILDEVSKYDKLISVHLMIEEPGPTLDKLNDYENILTVYVHVETVTKEDLEKERPYELALVLNPDTEVEKYKELIMMVRTIQIMTVVPGAQGKKFEESALEKQRQLGLIGFTGDIHIDGGVNVQTLSRLLRKPKAVLNVGSAITKSEDPKKSFDLLQDLANNMEGK